MTTFIVTPWLSCHDLFRKFSRVKSTVVMYGMWRWLVRISGAFSLVWVTPGKEQLGYTVIWAPWLGFSEPLCKVTPQRIKGFWAGCGEILLLINQNCSENQWTSAVWKGFLKSSLIKISSFRLYNAVIYQVSVFPLLRLQVSSLGMDSIWLNFVAMMLWTQKAILCFLNFFFLSLQNLSSYDIFLSVPTLG